MWKLPVKPAASGRGERSQCRGVTSCNEEANRQYRGEWHLGLNDARTSALTVKREESSLGLFFPGSKRLTPGDYSGATCCYLRKTVDHQTIEVPQCLRSCGVNGRYKAVPKCDRHAPVDGTVVLRPIIQGCQLNQSSVPQTGSTKGSSCGGACRSRPNPYAQSAWKLSPQSVWHVPLHVQSPPSAKQQAFTLAGRRHARQACSQEINNDH